MESLLSKYAGGRIPPLVAPEGEPDENVLLNGELVTICQRGFSRIFSIPPGVLVAGEVRSPIQEKWEEADFRLSEYARNDWTLREAGICRIISKAEDPFPVADAALREIRSAKQFTI